MNSSAQREYSRIGSRIASASPRSASPDTWSMIRLVSDVLVEASRILRRAHQRRADARGYLKPAVREKKNVALLQNRTEIGGIRWRIEASRVPVYPGIFKQPCYVQCLCSIVKLACMLESCALTDPGRVRSSNQDCFRIVPEIGLYLLADGMGGARGGERASQMAVEAVAEILGKSPHRDAAALLDAVEEANQRVLDEATRDARLEGMGTTLVAALETQENDIAIASVGDSRAWLLEERQAARDHGRSDLDTGGGPHAGAG